MIILEIRELIQDGYSLRETSQLIGVSVGSIRYYCKKSGIKTVYSSRIYGKQIKRRKELPLFANNVEKSAGTYADFHFLKGENTIRSKSLRKLTSGIGIFMLSNINQTKVWFMFNEDQTKIEKILKKENPELVIADKLYTNICKKLNINMRLPSNDRHIPNSCLGSRCDKKFGNIRQKVIPKLIAKRERLGITKEIFVRDYEDIIIYTYLQVLKSLKIEIVNEYEVIKYCLQIAKNRRKAVDLAKAQLPKP